MKQLIFTSSLAALLLSGSVQADGILNKKKNELTGEVQYTYFLLSSNDQQEFLEVLCEPTGGIEYTMCRIKYKNLPGAGYTAADI